MDHRFIKPKVFLSHSKADATFVHRLHEDLRRCQIEPWIDEMEIRTGKPWLDVIFEDGIPTCDSVFVYLTELSIQSNMVKKEIDVGILQQLKDRRVAFLPYVSDETLRSKLRPDIQTLQVPLWNNTNYGDVLPKFVAEVWRSFTERLLHTAVQEEQNRRLKAELELEKLTKGAQDSVFSRSEEVDFKYMWQSLDQTTPVIVSEKVYSTGQDKKLLASNSYGLRLNMASLFAQLPVVDGVEYNSWSLRSFIAQKAGEFIKSIYGSRDENGKTDYELEEFNENRDQLLMYGLLQSQFVPPPPTADTKMRWLTFGSSYKYLYSERMFRFRYWLAYSSLLSDALKFEVAADIVPKQEG